MKKIKTLIATLILFFCIGFQNSFLADATSTNVFEIYKNTNVKANSAIVLSSGYYFFGRVGQQIQISHFKGDFDYSCQSSGGNGTIELHMISDELEIDGEIESIVNLVTPFENSFGKSNIQTYGLLALHVKSYAVFYTDNTSLENVYALGINTKAMNTSATIAGNMTHFVDYDNPTSFEDIKKRYRATDNVDGDITNRLSFQTNYNPSQLKIGTFYVLIQVSDAAKNTTYAADLIHVKDFTPPKITLSEKEHIVEVHTVFTSEEAKKLFSVTDNHTPAASIQWTYIDQYQNKYDTLGSYTITATAKDLDNNTSSETLTIRIVDTTKPAITLAAGGDTIIADHPLTDSEIRALLNVSDNYYTLSTSQIQIVENTCTGAQGKTYKLKVKITDGSNNTQEKTFNYYLSDTVSPIIMVEKTLYVPLGSTYTNEQIINMLKEAGILDIEAKVSLSLNEAVTTEKEGTYELHYVETLPNGTQKENTVLLKVFSPIDSIDSSSSEPNSINPLYYLLLVLPTIGAILYFVFKEKNYEKM